MLKAFFLTFALFLATVTVPAQTLTESYRHETKKVLQALKARGITKIGCYYENNLRRCESPDSLAEYLNAVSFIELDKFEKAKESTRWGAFYSDSEPHVYLNRSVPHDPEFIGYIGMHELLGSKKIKESDFDISLAAYQLINFRPSGDIFYSMDQYEFIQGRIENYLFTSSNEPKGNHGLSVSRGGDSGGGGVFVGGGGGDTTTFAIRVEILAALYKRFHDPVVVDTLLITLPIEFTNDYGTEVDYQMLEDTLLNRIVVPRRLLGNDIINDRSALKQAMEDIAWFMASFRPDLAGIPYRQLRAGVEPLSLEGLHPQSIQKYWCRTDYFRRAPHASCK